jgi:hypothetical protein
MLPKVIWVKLTTTAELLSRTFILHLAVRLCELRREVVAMSGPNSCLIISATLIASAFLAGMAFSQGSTAEIGAPVTTEERLAIETSALADQRIRAIVGEGQPRIIMSAEEVDKSEAEAFLTGRSTTPPMRRVTVILINPHTQQAAQALIERPQNRVIAVQSVAASNVPFLRDDADEALALAKHDANVRRAVGDSLDRFQLLESGTDARTPFAVQALPLRSTDPRDVCSVDRCVDLIFRTESGYLPFRAHVNLTRRSVEIHGGAGGQHR